jgi:hypothetical protein
MNDHLKNINMSYFEHMRCALWFSYKLFTAAIILFVHSIFPNLFVNYGSKVVKEVNNEMNKPHSGK